MVAKDKHQYDPVAVALKQASTIKALASLSAAFKNGTVTVLKTPDSIKQRVRQPPAQQL